MIKRIIYVCQDFNRRLTRDNINAYAASTAFFIFLSFVPMLLFICSLIPYTPLTKANLMESVTLFMPDYLDGLLIVLIDEVYQKSVGILSTVAIVTIWSAGKGMLALMRGLNVVNSVVENRNYVILRLVASGYTVLILLVTIFTLLLSVFGPLLLEGMEEIIPQLAPVFDLIMAFRILFSVIVLTFVFTLIFTYIPNKKLKLQAEILGAFFTAVAWNVFSFGFSVYITRFNAFTGYGSLGTIIIAMMWLYFCMYLMLIGANVNRYFKPAIEILLK